MLEFFINYWLQWLLGIIAAGIGIWAKHYIKLEKDNIKHIKEEYKEEIIKEIEEKINKIEEKSINSDKKICEEITSLNNAIENINTGLLSVQGKNFRDTCIILLTSDHEITVAEYEQFEEDYEAYKALRGNHKGDALHGRVVEKFNGQINKGTRD